MGVGTGGHTGQGSRDSPVRRDGHDRPERLSRSEVRPSGDDGIVCPNEQGRIDNLFYCFAVRKLFLSTSTPKRKRKILETEYIERNRTACSDISRMAKEYLPVNIERF